MDAIQPINYMAAMPQQNFLQDIQGGLQLGIGLRNAQLQQQQQQLALQRQQQYKVDSAAFSANPTPQGASALTLKYPEQHEAIKQGWSQLNEGQQQAELKDAADVTAALHLGRTDVSQSLIDRKIQAMKNSGQPTDTLQAISDAIKTDPTKVYGGMMKLMSGLPGGDKVLENIGRIGTEQRVQELQAPTMALKQGEARKAGADATVAEAAVPFAGANAEAAAIKAKADATTAAVGAKYAEQKVKAEIANVVGQNSERWARLGLDRDRLTSETQIKVMELNQKFGELPSEAQTIVNGSSAQAVAAQQAVQQYSALASKLDALPKGTGKGAFSTAGEWLAQATGNQDALTGMRQEYTRLMSQGVIKMLPPGPASDKDISLVREGFPKPGADAAYLSSFLRGMAKISALDAATSNAKSEWAAANRNLGPARGDLTVYGVKVPKGTTFSDFSAQFMNDKAGEIAGAAAVSWRGYMRFAAPQTGGASGTY